MTMPARLDTPPDLSPDAAKSALDDALDDLDLGTWDREVRSYIELADPAYVAAIASWLQRARHAGAVADYEALKNGQEAGR
jgi:hypothetical protein